MALREVNYHAFFLSLHKKLTFTSTADQVTFTEEILNGKLHFLCSVFRYSNDCLA